jgi:hypothetical protein
MDYEWWDDILANATYLVLALTFAVGAAALFTSRKVGSLQRERIAQSADAAAQANEQAARANERAANLELEAAAQRERAAVAERELLALKERLAPRQLTAEQQARITARLRDYADLSFYTVTYPNDPEPASLAAAIAAAISAAGWNHKPPSRTMLLGIAAGVVINVAPGEREAAAGNALADALRSSGIECGVVESDPGNGVSVKVQVGRKPGL